MVCYRLSRLIRYIPTAAKEKIEPSGDQMGVEGARERLSAHCGREVKMPYTLSVKLQVEQLI